MSQVKVQGDPSGTGIFTIASPNSNSNVTLTLPTTSGTVLTNAGPYTASSSASNGAVTIDASNNVGINVSSPAYNGMQLNTTSGDSFFHVTRTAQGTTGADGLTIGLGSDENAYLYNRENTSLIFGTNNVERMRVNAGAAILCLSGGNTSATGTGIAFPATQSASADANVLDDYEEGTWSAAIIGAGGSNPSVSYVEQTGRYTKIGNTVRFSFSIQFSSLSGGSGSLAVSLPFATSASASWQGSFILAYGAGITTNTKGVGYTDPGRSDFFIRSDVNNTTNLGMGDIGSAGHLIGGGVFMVA